MAKNKRKKANQTGIALACWFAGLFILIIVFFIKKDDIYTNLKTTRFFERIFGTTPEFIQKHEIKEIEQKEKETVITLKPSAPEQKKSSQGVAEKSSAQKKADNSVKVEKTDDRQVNQTASKNKIEDSQTSESSQNKIKEEAQTKTEAAASSEKKIEALSKVKEEPKTITAVNQKLYFVYIGEDGVVSRKMITRQVEKNDSPLSTNINTLLRGPLAAEAGKGYKTLIPQGTNLLSASVKDGVAYLNFSEDFEFNSIGPDGYVGQLMQIVYTATEFSTVNSVQFLIDGQKKDYLGSEGVWIGSPLSRASF